MAFRLSEHHPLRIFTVTGSTAETVFSRSSRDAGGSAGAPLRPPLHDLGGRTSTVDVDDLRSGVLNDLAASAMRSASDPKIWMATDAPLGGTSSESAIA